MQQLEEELVRLRQLIDNLMSRVQELERNNRYRIPVQPNWPQPIYPYQPIPTYPYQPTPTYPYEVTCSDNTTGKVI